MVDRNKAAIAIDRGQLAALYTRADAGRWGVTIARFEQALQRSCAHRYGSGPPDSTTLSAYLNSLHVEDLALACACRDGDDRAWRAFLHDFQPTLRLAARAIAGQAGVDLADVLLADLYGTSISGGERRSLLDYFHGRSRLTTWLRTVLAQRHVDALRAGRRSVPLDDEAEASASPTAQWEGRAGPDVEAAAASAADRRHLLALFERQLHTAMAALAPSDRLRLSYYYVHGLTLAHIGRLMGEHESSASRKLDKTRRDLRYAVETTLKAEHGLTDDDLQQCYQETSRHGALDLSTLLPPSAIHDRTRGSGAADIAESAQYPSQTQDVSTETFKG